MGLAANARHVVAARILLDVDRAIRAALDVVGVLPLLISPVSAGNMVPMLLTCEVLVVLDVAGGTDATKARAALEDGAFGTGSVDLRTVGCGTVVEFVRPLVDVREERSLEHFFLLVRREYLFQYRQCDGFLAFGIRAQANDGERPGIGCGEEVEAKTRSTVCMTASDVDWVARGAETDGAI